MSRAWEIGLGLSLGLTISCGGRTVEEDSKEVVFRKPGAKAGPALPGTSARSAPKPKRELMEKVRKRPFSDQDFVDSEQNRDPFRSFLSDYSGIKVVTQYNIKLPKYSLDEVKLIAIVGPVTEGSREETGYTQARAMFLDPTGTGVSVVRGEHISKADAKVTRIDAEKGKVYVELKQDPTDPKTKMIERVLELHQNEPLATESP